MKSTVNYLIEPFLTQYFLIDAICQGFLTEEERYKNFRELAEIFCVSSDNEIDEYYHLSNSGQYKQINDYSAYERLCRTIEFEESRGFDVGLNEKDKMILAHKRESMLIKSEIFKQGKNLTKDIITDTLLEMATSGNIDAMVTLSYMEYNGLCVGKDHKNAIKRILLCAKWNNLFGNLMGVRYDAENTDYYYDTLYTVLKSSNQREVFKYICSYNSYCKTCKKNSVSRLIEKAFGLNIVKRNLYDRIFAKVAFSKLVSLEDKEKLLLNKKKEAIVSLSEIPFDAEWEEKLEFNKKSASDISLDRKDELQQIFCSIFPAINGNSELYRTLLIASDDEYVSEMYAKAIKNGFDESKNVIEIDAGMLTKQDFAGAKEHFILRGLTETKKTRTVFIVKNCNEIGEMELSELIKLLDYDYRRKFRLIEPTVSIDISDITLVLIASEFNQNVLKLSQECEVIRVKHITDVEKKQIVESIFKARAEKFGCKKAKLDKSGKDYLSSLDTEQIVRVVDGVLKRATYENIPEISTEMIRNFSKHQNIGRSKREFGYMGVNYDEKY